MPLQVLERVVPEPPDRPERPPEEYLPMQDVTRRIALDGEWSPALAERMQQLFDGLAPEWNLLASETRLDVTRDALARGGIPGRGIPGGGVPGGGTCLEIGSGTGIHTPLLAGHFSSVVSLDFAAEMLSRAPRDLSAMVRGDASQLPLRGGSVDAVVCVNAFLFPAEYDRVLRPGGCVALVSTSGDRTPIYLPPADVLAALPGEWAGATSEAAWGSWTVARRAEG